MENLERLIRAAEIEFGETPNWKPLLRDAKQELANITAARNDSIQLHALTGKDLVARVVNNARSRSRSNPSPRWVCVQDAFALGSQYSQDLCRMFGLDPDELVRR